VKGNPDPYTALFSERDDITIANPFGPVRRGRKEAIETMQRAASLWRDGEIVGFERISTHSSDELACIVEVERFRGKVGASEEVAPIALRTTSVFRLEDGSWKIVHRHADAITAERPPESVIQA
jgi:ketosteroid isomerase-like protein